MAGPMTAESQVAAQVRLPGATLQLPAPMVLLRSAQAIEPPDDVRPQQMLLARDRASGADLKLVRTGLFPKQEPDGPNSQKFIDYFASPPGASNVTQDELIQLINDGYRAGGGTGLQASVFGITPGKVTEVVQGGRRFLKYESIISVCDGRRVKNVNGVFCKSDRYQTLELSIRQHVVLFTVSPEIPRRSTAGCTHVAWTADFSAPADNWKNVSSLAEAVLGSLEFDDSTIVEQQQFTYPM